MAMGLELRPQPTLPPAIYERMQTHGIRYRGRDGYEQCSGAGKIRREENA